MTYKIPIVVMVIYSSSTPIIMFSPSIHCVDLYLSSLFYITRIKHFFALTRTEEIKWKVKEDQEKSLYVFSLTFFFGEKV